MSTDEMRKFIQFIFDQMEELKAELCNANNTIAKNPEEQKRSNEEILSNFNNFSLAPMDSITIVILAVSLPLLFVREISEEYGLIRLQGRVKQTATWAFYIFLFCFLLSFGVLDGGQFIYISF